jgi:hypothetical protein
MLHFWEAFHNETEALIDAALLATKGYTDGKIQWKLAIRECVFAFQTPVFTETDYR